MYYMETKKELTTKQQDFLDNLIACGGNPKLAAEMAGYAPGSYTTVVKALKSEILDMAESVLAVNAPKASLKLIQIMDSDEPIPQANIRLQAAQTLLDRVGVAKKERLDVKVEAPSGLFILPSKNPTIIEDAEYEETD
jgi:tRNA A37 threonylcarbamoyladenosine synthetase subunit TsaC/SUA5/YrdC